MRLRFDFRNQKDHWQEQTIAHFVKFLIFAMVTALHVKISQLKLLQTKRLLKRKNYLQKVYRNVSPTEIPTSVNE